MDEVMWLFKHTLWNIKGTTWGLAWTIPKATLSMYSENIYHTLLLRFCHVNTVDTATHRYLGTAYFNTTTTKTTRNPVMFHQLRLLSYPTSSILA